MTYRAITAAALVLLSLHSAPSYSQKAAPAELGGLRFITGPKGDRPHTPGLNAALLLSDEQKQRLAKAHRETLGSEPLVEARRKVKTDPNVSEADRQSVRKAIDDAQAQFDRSIAEILTAPQKELVQRVQVIYAQTRDAVSRQYSPQLVRVKGNQGETLRLRTESQLALQADFKRRVSEILTPDQRAASEQASAAEKERGASKPKSN